MKFLHFKNKNTPIFVGVFLFLFLIGIATKCSAEGLYGGGGVSLGYDIDVYSWGTSVEYVTKNHFNFGVTYLNEQTLGYSWTRVFHNKDGDNDADDYKIERVKNTLGHMYIFSAQYEVRPFIPYTFVGLGLAARTGGENIKALLPLPVEFSLSGGIDYKKLRLEFRHISNAGIREPNKGMNWVQAMWRFK